MISVSRRTVLSLSSGMAILAGVGLTVWGLLHQKWPDTLPVRSWNDAADFLLFSIGCALIITVAQRLTNRRVAAIAIILGILISILAGSVWPLLATLLYAAASLALGHIAFRVLHISDHSIDDVYKLLIGAGLYASLISLTAHLPVNYSWVYLLGLMTPVFVERRWLYDKMKDLTTRLSQSSPPSLYQDWPNVVFATLCLLYFAFAFLPELTHDGLAMHLFVPTHIATRNEWGFDPTLYVWALMPMLGDWHYSIGYLIAGETGTRLINVGFLYLVTYLVRDLVLWAGGNEKGATWAALLFLSTPLTFMEGSSLHIESIWACYLISGLLLVLRFSTEHEYRTSGLVLGGLLLGFATAAKSVTFIYLLMFLLPLLIRLRQIVSRSLWLPVSKGLTLFVMFGSIPYITAYSISGNPVFPFYNAYFNSPFFPSVNFDNLLFKSAAHWDLPYQLVFATGKYIEGTTGASGFQWLMLLIPALVIEMLLKNRRSMMLIVVGTLSLILLFHFQSYLRYAFPVLILLCALIGVTMSSASRLGRFLNIGMVIVISGTIGLNLIFFGSSVWRYRNIPVMEVFRQAGPDRLILKKEPIRKAVAVVNLFNETHSPVAFLCPTRGAGINADALYASWYNKEFQNSVTMIDSPLSLAKVLEKYNSRYVILDSTFGTTVQRDIVESSTRLIATFGTTSVRVLKDELEFQDELIASPDFSNLEQWTLTQGVAQTDEGFLIVNGASRATQYVSVRSGTIYLNSVKSRCHDETTQGRVQVNWLDEKGNLLSTNIKVYACRNEWHIVSQEVVAPADAVNAIVYASSHGERPIEINYVSFKK